MRKLCVVIVLLLVVGVSVAQEDEVVVTSTTLWHIDEELCLPQENCYQSWHFDEASMRLYIISPGDQLHIISSNGLIEYYDLSPIPPAGMLSEIAFYGDSIRYLNDEEHTFYIYNLLTTALTQIAPEYRFTSCKTASSHVSKGFAQLPDGRIIVCGYGSSSGTNFNVSILDPATEQTQEIAGLDGGQPWSQRGWYNIVAGKDYAVYIHTFGGHLLTSLVPDSLSRNSTTTFVPRWDVASEQWSVVEIDHTSLSTGRIGDLVAVDASSNLYFSLLWGDNDGGHYQFTKTNSQGDILWVLGENDLIDGKLTDVTSDGKLIIQDYSMTTTLGYSIPLIAVNNLPAGDDVEVTVEPSDD